MRCTGRKGAASASVRETVDSLTETVVRALLRSRPGGGTFHIEDVQDQVELGLMRGGHHEVARAYVLYRERRAQERAKQVQQAAPREPALHVTDNGQRVPLDMPALQALVESACAGLGADVKAEPILAETRRNLYDGVPIDEVHKAAILAARTLLEKEPAYTRATARLLLHTIRKEVLGRGGVAGGDGRRATPSTFRNSSRAASRPNCSTRRCASSIWRGWVRRSSPSATCSSTTWVCRRCTTATSCTCSEQRIELPQAFFMRVAMGLALQEIDREARAIEFYDVLSSFDFMSSTPTLFNSGTLRSQLSSCYLTTVADDLDGIYEALKENALLSKYAGGLGNDWTPVRALGSYIKGTNGKSQGVVPFLKVVNDTAVAVNQGGKRKGAVCAYLESWHLDIEEFLELRKNTGDDRRRTHDMNTANWIPDLFMKRVMEGSDWTLFSPSTCPDLHDKFGAEFEAAYIAYEAKADRGELKLHKRLPARDLWRKMLTMLFETGHPGSPSRMPATCAAPQQHVGVVHSSNLCTEITLNTGPSEIAVCNLGSVNLAQHLKDGAVDQAKLKKTVATAMRMLDNVIDINYYAVKKARDSNLRHRPVGLGVMGFQDALYELRLPYASQEAVAFADRSMESLCYHAYWASTELAEERGRYSSYRSSLWDRGILPLDTLDLLASQRDAGRAPGASSYVEVDRSATMDWAALRSRIAQHGMRNSNCVAIAPTATISNIVGVDASIEPCFGNLSVKSNLSGEFTIVNEYLVRDLKRLNLWDDVMVMDLKHFDGSLRRIDRVPEEVKKLYATAFEVEAQWLVEAAARRQKWIDQAQSLNIYLAGASGRKLDEIYKLAWLRGLKTTYYLRTIGATHAEKSTVKSGALNAVSMGGAAGLSALDAVAQQARAQTRRGTRPRM